MSMSSKSIKKGMFKGERSKKESIKVRCILAQFVIFINEFDI